MKHTRRVGAVIALGAVTMATAATAAPKPKPKPKRHAFSGVVTVTTLVSQKGSPPAPGSSTKNTGTVSSKQWGKGKLSASATFGNATAPGSYPIHGKASFAFKKGTLKFTFTMRATWQNPQVYMGGSARVTGGTGKFKKAKGSFTFQGSSPLILSPAVVNYTGKLSY